MLHNEKSFFIFFESNTMQDRIANMANPFRYPNNESNTPHSFKVYFSLPISLAPKLDVMTGKLMEYYTDKYLIDDGSKDYPYYVTFFPHQEEKKSGCLFVDCYLTITIYRKRIK